MANQLPLIIDAGVVQQIQTGDSLTDVVYADAAFTVADMPILATGTDRDTIVHVAGEAFQVSTGTLPVLIGVNAGASAVSFGTGCVGVGGDALRSGTYGNSTIALGQDAGESATTGASVVLLGKDAGGISTVGADSFVMGSAAGSTSTVGSNCFIAGSLACAVSANVGNFTVAVGQNAFRGATIGTSNFAFGRDAGRILNSATANDNLFFGNQSGNVVGQLATASNSIVFGASSFSTKSNQVVLGSASITETVLRGDVLIEDTHDLVFDTTTGSMIASATTEKIAFWGATPIVQPAAANQAALTNSSGGTRDGTLAAVTDTSASDQSGPINDNFTDVHELLDEIRTALVNAGLIKGSA